MTQKEITNEAGSDALKSCVVTAKIDYATFEAPHKLNLPVDLVGTIMWSRKSNYKRFTIHDPAPRDFRVLQCAFGSIPLLELEVAIDIKPRPGLSGSRQEIIDSVMVNLYARELEPSSGLEMHTRFRAYYRRLGIVGQVAPFNMRLPRPTDQQLHCGRDDPAQVKTYMKRTDAGRVMPELEIAARAEVRLAGSALAGHGLHSVDDLLKFSYRRRLSPYFRFVAGVTSAKPKRWTPGMAAIGLAQQQINARHWEKSGVGAFVSGGPRNGQRLRLVRDVVSNNRVGQALTRLEQRIRNPDSCAT